MKIIEQLDADTYIVEVDGKRQRVRLNNIDTHESTTNNNPTTLGHAAKAYAKDVVRSVDGSTETDVYGRTLGAARDDQGQDVGNRLIRQGLAAPTSSVGDDSFRAFLRDGPAQESDPFLQSLIDVTTAAREDGVRYANSESPSFERNDRRGTGARALDRGAEGLKANIYGFLQAANNIVGDDEESEEYRRKAAYHAEQAGLIRKDIQSFRDVDSLSKAATYAYELLAEEAPSLALDAVATMTGVGLGAAVGRRAATTALRKKLGDAQFEKLVTDHPQLLANVKNAGGTSGAKRGAGAAYVAGTYPQEAGAVQLELNENGLEDEGATALGMGAVSTLVQAAPELALAGKLLKQADVDASDLAGIVGTAKTLAKNVGTTAAAEGAAEGAATVLQKSAVALHKDDYEVFSEQNIREMQEAIVAGGVMGGTLATAGTAAGAGYRKADQIYREKRETQAAERQAALDAEQQAQATQQAQQTRGFTIDTTPAAETTPTEPYKPSFVFGNPAQDTAPNENFNPKLDSDMSAPAAAPTVESAPAEGAAQAIPTAEQEQKGLEQHWDERFAELNDQTAQLIANKEAMAQEARNLEASQQEEAKQAAFTPTEEQIAQARQHPAFAAVTSALGKQGLKDGRIPAEVLSAEERETLAGFDSIIVDPSDGQTMIVDPQLVDDVLRYSPPEAEVEEETPNFPQGQVYAGPAPTMPSARANTVGESATYGDGNEDPDGIYDRGTGRSVFKQLAKMAADETQMRRNERTGLTKATSQFAEMVNSIDPLSDEFDTQLENLAQYVRTWGDGKADEVNQMLDRARLRTPNTDNTVSVLREAHTKLSQIEGTQVKGDTLTKFQAAVKFVNQLSDSMAKTVPGFQKADRFTDQMLDIIDALNTGAVKLNAKQQSVVHAVASNAFVSTTGLWQDKTGTTDKVYSEQSDKVTDAQNAATRDEKLDAPAFIVTMPRDAVDRNEIFAKAKRLKEWLTGARADLEAELNKEKADFSRIQRLNQAIEKASEWLFHAAKYRPDNSRRQKALTALVDDFQKLGDDAAPLKEALRVHHEAKGDLKAQQRYENEDGSEAPAATLRTTGPKGIEEVDLVDVAGESESSLDDFDIAISPEAEEYINRYHRVRLGLSKDVVEQLPLALRIRSFARTFTDTVSRAPNDFKAPETANERRVRLASTLQTTISVVSAFKTNFMSVVKDDMFPEFSAKNPGKTMKDMEKDSAYIEVETKIERELFEAALNRIAGEDNPEFEEVFDLASARLAIRNLRAEVQNLLHANAAPSSVAVLDGNEKQVASEKPRWYNDTAGSTEGSILDTRSKVLQATAFAKEGRALPRTLQPFEGRNGWESAQLSEEEIDDLDAIQLAKLNERKAETLRRTRDSGSAQGNAPLGNRTSREMYDVSTTMLDAINTAVRAMFDARFESKSHPEIRDAVAAGDYAALINYAADNDLIPAAGNGLEQLIKTTTEMAASNRTFKLTRYLRTAPPKGDNSGVVSIQLVDEFGNETKAYIDVAEYIGDHLDRIAPNMVDADHGARKGSTALEDLVQDDSDPLTGRAAFDRVLHIQNAFDIMLSDLMAMEPDHLGFTVKSDSIRSLLSDDAQRSLVLLKDGTDSVTLKHLRDTMATRTTQARIADNHDAAHDISETKRQKATAAMRLEKAMGQLLDIVSPELGGNGPLTLLATELSIANGTRKSAAQIARAMVNIPRQLGALSRLVYGKDERHLDDANDLDSDAQAFDIAYGKDGRRLPNEEIGKARALKAKSQSDYLFTEPSLPAGRLDALEKIAQDALNSAHLSKTGVSHDALLDKYAIKEGGKDFTKTTELVDIQYLASLFDVIHKNAAALKVEDPLTGAELMREYKTLVETREKLALSFNERDYSSIANDKAMPEDMDNSVMKADSKGRDVADRDATARMEHREKKGDIRLTGGGDPDLIGKITGETAAERFESGMAALRTLNPGKEPNPQRVRDHLRQSTPHLDSAAKKLKDNEAEATQIGHNYHVIPQIRNILGNSRAARVVSNALARMTNIVFGDSRFIDNIVFSDSGDDGGSIEARDGKMYIALPFGSLDTFNAARMSRFIKVAAHEFGHAAATFDTLDEKDASDMMRHYLKDVPEPQRSKYSIDEYMADLVAMQILQEMTVEAIRVADDVTAARLTKNPGNTAALLTGDISRMVSSLVARISSLLRIAGEFGTKITNDGMFVRSPQLEFAEYLLKYSRIRKDKFDALAPGNKLFYTPRGANATMAKAKYKANEIAKGGLDSALVKLFKPTAMRLQKIDRQLARMFFNPPGAKQEQGMGLMDMAVSTRTKMVNYFGRMYPKIDDFRKDYTEFLTSGKASTALNAVFRRAAEDYTAVNPEFQYTGVPIMLNMDEIARRGAEFVQLLNHEKADDLLKSFDRNGGDASMNTDIKPANPFGRQELLDDLIRNRPETMKALQAAGFFDPPTVAGLNKFFGALSMRLEFEKVFGGKQDIIPELGLSARSPNMRLKARLDAITDPQQRREAIAMIGSMLGFDGARVHPAWRKTQDWTISVVSAAILPLSGFASLPDPMMPFIRTRSWSEAVKGLFSVVKAYSTDYKRTAELTRTFSLVANSIHDTAWSTVVINKDGNTIPERMSELLFKYNGLQFLTNVSRNVSAVLALDMVRRHGSGATAYSRQFLAEMGISAANAERLVAYMDEHGTVPQYAPGNDAVNELHDIAQRVVTTFTNSSLIHPNKAQLPAIANDPNFRVLTLLKPFLYGFHSTIYGGGLRAGRAAMGSPRTLGEFLLNSPAGAMPLILAFGLMMPLAAAGLMAREHFRDALFGSDKADKLAAMDDMEYLSKIFSRAGGYGMLEYPMQIWEATQVDYRNPFIAAAGPVVGTINDGASSMYGAFVKGNRDTVKFGLIEIPVD